ncbi:hypothetical protein [Arthrobacter sp. ISL-65]|uniref:HAAS signaling domain-containing protein n=1 Tax=Arthrobacter sp. ISL-65 TaxID=2819112 RepID=UPI001BE5C050|nr:hypothetical protein [Arthrobacter sp. ISL-65]MBT2549745.1 hypothetical protein [Arthrobacter sp. ISL-65]
MTTLEYFKALALALRQRKLSEDQIADVLRELQSHLQETGAHPEDAFGSPKEYAERFPKGSTVSRGSKVAYLAVAVMILLIGVKVFTGQVLGISLGLPGTLVYLAATVIVTFALTAWSNVLQRQLPERTAEDLSRTRQNNGT